MAAHHDTPLKIEQFTFSSGLKKTLLSIILIGAVIAVLGIWVAWNAEQHPHEEAHGSAHSSAIHDATPPAELVSTNHPEGEGHGAQAETHAATEHKEHGEHEAPKEHGEHAEHGAAAHGDAHHGPSWLTRIFANLLLNNVLFVGVSIFGVFFIALNYVANAGWAVGLKRIPESLGSFLPIGFILMLLIIPGMSYLYHWTAEGITDPASPAYDAIIAGKAAYLNVPFFIVRLALIFGIWILFYTILRKLSIKEDKEGGLIPYQKSIRTSALFIICFAFTLMMASWDWLMSIDTHWFSTIYWVYTLSGVILSGFITVTFILLYLKGQGLMGHINNNHFHDLGKFIFGFSIFWAYIWLSQFLLIWYANMPEETLYYVPRFQGHYKLIFFLNLFINFFTPFLYLMTREAKRQANSLKVILFILIFGRWLDLYLMIMPGTVAEHNGFIMEIGFFLIYFGIFGYVVMQALTKMPLVPKNHPLLEESLQHHI
jgi:hypothetical protein